MKKLPADRLPRNTNVHLRVLLKRCNVLMAAGVLMPRQSLQVLSRVIYYVAENDVEGARRKPAQETDR